MYPFVDLYSISSVCGELHAGSTIKIWGFAQGVPELRCLNLRVCFPPIFRSSSGKTIRQMRTPSWVIRMVQTSFINMACFVGENSRDFTSCAVRGDKVWCFSLLLRVCSGQRVALMTVKFDVAESTEGQLLLVQFHSNRCTGWALGAIFKGYLIPIWNGGWQMTTDS